MDSYARPKQNTSKIVETLFSKYQHSLQMKHVDIICEEVLGIINYL